MPVSYTHLDVYKRQVKEPRAEVATVSFVPKKEFNIQTECRDDTDVNAVGVISNVIVFSVSE